MNLAQVKAYSQMKGIFPPKMLQNWNFMQWKQKYHPVKLRADVAKQFLSSLFSLKHAKDSQTASLIYMSIMITIQQVNKWMCHSEIAF